MKSFKVSLLCGNNRRPDRAATIRFHRETGGYQLTLDDGSDSDSFIFHNTHSTIQGLLTEAQKNKIAVIFESLDDIATLIASSDHTAE